MELKLVPILLTQYYIFVSPSLLLCHQAFSIYSEFHSISFLWYGEILTTFSEIGSTSFVSEFSSSDVFALRSSSSWVSLFFLSSFFFFPIAGLLRSAKHFSASHLFFTKICLWAVFLHTTFIKVPYILFQINYGNMESEHMNFQALLGEFWY